ncbi:hypothetical protein G2W53_000280 [Senna tora]|uniref:Uncharacterized protein n=1 Tax=Senna tora TaxID=362788 RepID=A0A835CKF9_9FABA|nr:hypothetical protein G2W53_000280 [Senna tora]
MIKMQPCCAGSRGKYSGPTTSLVALEASRATRGGFTAFPPLGENREAPFPKSASDPIPLSLTEKTHFLSMASEKPLLAPATMFFKGGGEEHNPLLLFPCLLLLFCKSLPKRETPLPDFLSGRGESLPGSPSLSSVSLKLREDPFSFSEEEEEIFSELFSMDEFSETKPM